LVERGHDATLLCGGPVGNHSYPVVEAGSTFGQYLRVPPIYLRHFRDRDLVVDVSNGMSFFAPLWRRGPSMCLVHHVHTPTWKSSFTPPVAAVGRSLERNLMPWVYRHRLFMAVSESTANNLELIGVDRNRIRVVPNGVDIALAPTSSRSPEPLFVCLSRLLPHKRVDLVLRLWERVRPITGGRLVVAGDGPERDRLRTNAGPGVEFLGHVSEDKKAQLLSEAWLLLQPSRLEGWGLVVMEAAQLGTPALAFDVPGLRDSIAHQESGVLVADETEYSKQWIDLTFDTTRRSMLGLGARRRAAQFSWSSTLDLFLQAAEDAVALSGSRQPFRNMEASVDIRDNAPAPQEAIDLEQAPKT
jgi:glycosyltransferase involved in cell wall biosynthesis